MKRVASIFLAAVAALPLTAEAQEAVTGSLLPQNLSPFGMFLSADLVVKAVIVILILASVATWTIWIAKSLELAMSRRRERAALALLMSAHSLGEAGNRTAPDRSLAADMVRAAAAEFELGGEASGPMAIDRVRLRLGRVAAAAQRQVGRRIGILATIGATSPFIGLFGTVWGIMNSFIGISRAHTTNLAVVAPGIAEALLATAAGLIAAIPAVVIYNLFARSIGEYRAVLEDEVAAVQRLASADLERRPLRLLRAAE